MTFHPLAHVPGPRLWAMSRIPYFYHLVIGRLPYKILELQKQYGPVVRIAPIEVLFTTESVWSIYLKPVGKPQLQREPNTFAPLEDYAPGFVLEPSDFHHNRIRLVNFLYLCLC